jgi:hypothetical protein
MQAIKAEHFRSGLGFLHVSGKIHCTSFASLEWEVILALYIVDISNPNPKNL